MYAKAVENAVATYQLKENKKPTSFSDIDKYIQYEGAKIICKTKILSNDLKIYIDECSVEGKMIKDAHYGIFVEDEEGISINLPKNLIPIEYDGKNWVITSLDRKWYSYSSQEWANAVILDDDVSRTVGTKLDIETDVKAMFVYIPRYEYKIVDEHGKHSDGSDGTQTLPGEIKVNFIQQNQIQANEEGYIIHPAFLWDNNNDGSISNFFFHTISGIWVGKFEISHTTTTESIECQDELCEEGNNLRILPNVSALRNNTVSSFFYSIKSMSKSGNVFGIDSNKMDVHMIKNSEWGAVAYLSQSIYGKYGNNDYIGENKEIYQNKSSNYITGSFNGTPSCSNKNSQCTYDDFNNNCGIGASTTGNITGIYDMSGGADEYVMGNYNNNVGQSEFTNFPEKKYYNEYTGEYYGKVDVGHAMSETQDWYEDLSEAKPIAPWIGRGGRENEQNAGIFWFRSFFGHGDWAPDLSTRVVFIEKNF